mmetsp:Transcript_1873/g.5651  ORF Transcript_1873/g.5651 Transcript_1873/m.5651 type:complete len:300 (-) Transcript_1873:51-950(-)
MRVLAALEVKVLHRLECGVEVATASMYSAHAHDAEVAKDKLNVSDTDLGGESNMQPEAVRILLVLTKDVVDVGLADHPVEGTEDLHGVVDMQLASKKIDVALRPFLDVLGAESAEVLILIDEFIHHVPQPLDREIDALHVILVGEDSVEQQDVVLPRLDALLNRDRLSQSRVHVTEVKLLVEHDEDIVILHQRSDLLDRVGPGLLLVESVRDAAEPDLVAFTDAVQLLLTDERVRLVTDDLSVLVLLLYVDISMNQVLELPEKVRHILGHGEVRVVLSGIVVVLVLRHVILPAQVVLAG